MGTSFAQEEENIVSFLESTATRLDRMAEDRNRHILEHRVLGQESERLGQMLLDSQHRMVELLDIFRTVSHANRLLRRQRGNDASVSERQEIYQSICDELSDQQPRNETVVHMPSDIQTSTPEIHDHQTIITTDTMIPEIEINEKIPDPVESSNQNSPQKAKKSQVDEVDSMSADVYRNIPKPPEGLCLRVVLECRRLARRCRELLRAVKRPFIACYRSNQAST